MKIYLTKLIVLLFICTTSCSTNEESVTNVAPNVFSLNEVVNNATDVALQPSFNWEVATDLDGDAITYDFYLSTQNPPTNLVMADLSNTWYDLQEELDYSTTYYWKVVAKDEIGTTTTSGIASFTTLSEPANEQLVGKWYFDRELSNGNISEFSDCEKNSFLEFNEDFTFHRVDYFDDYGTGNCVNGGEFVATYEVSENYLILSSNGDITSQTQFEISEDELALLNTYGRIILIK